MKNIVKCTLLLLLILSISFIVPIQSSGIVLSVNAQAFADNRTDEKVNEDNKVEEKFYSKATLEDDFTGDSVLVVLDRKTSEINKQHKENFFGSFEKRSVKDLTIIEKSESSFQDLTKNEKIENNELLNNQLVNHEEFRQIFEIKLPDDDKQNVLNVIKQLEKTEGVLYAGPNYYSHPNAAPNDPHYTANRQWHLNGTNGINAPSAWDITKGSNSVRVGVIDTGIANHPDLSANLVAGWDFYNNNNITTDDLDSHGTSVAGIIGAKGDNSIGVAGIAWNVSLVPLQISYTNPSTGRQTSTNSLTIQAINYAKNNNIHILNHSWGGYSYDYAVQSAINSYNGLYVCSAGNGDSNGNGINIDTSPYYPASYTGSNMITVGATNVNGQRAQNAGWWGSNYGANSVDIFAPGCYVGGDLYSTKTGNTYGNFNGTSSSAPMVTGVAALLLSKYDFMSAIAIKKAIMDNVETNVPSSIKDNCVSGGRLDAGKVLETYYNAYVTQTSPIMINNATDLQNIGNFPNKYYRLAQGIDVNFSCVYL